MKLVPQIDFRGCGVAAVAMVTGYSYSVVRDRALRLKCWRANYGMNGKMLRHLLNSFMFPVIRVTLKPIKGTAVVNIHSANRSFLHWVVVHRGKVYDPDSFVYQSMEAYLAVRPGCGTGRWYWI